MHESNQTPFELRKWQRLGKFASRLICSRNPYQSHVSVLNHFKGEEFADNSVLSSLGRPDTLAQLIPSPATQDDEVDEIYRAASSCPINAEAC
jgi:hypothetical protein